MWKTVKKNQKLKLWQNFKMWQKKLWQKKIVPKLNSWHHLKSFLVNKINLTPKQLMYSGQRFAISQCFPLYGIEFSLFMCADSSKDTTIFVIHEWGSYSLWKISSKHHYSQSVRARELKFWDIVHLSPCVTCHMSNATCHLSSNTCHVKKRLWS